jgi:nucleoid DNA-binding protein
VSTRRMLIAALEVATQKPKEEVAEQLATLADMLQTILLQEGAVHVPGLGKIVLRVRKPRAGRNPRTGEALQIPVGITPKFRPSKDLKSSLVVTHPS